jgi:hypothetical protein
VAGRTGSDCFTHPSGKNQPAQFRFGTISGCRRKWEIVVIRQVRNYAKWVARRLKLSVRKYSKRGIQYISGVLDRWIEHSKLS